MSEENKTNAMEEKPESVQTEDKKETLQAKTGKKERKKDKKKAGRPGAEGTVHERAEKGPGSTEGEAPRKWYSLSPLWWQF